VPSSIYEKIYFKDNKDNLQLAAKTRWARCETWKALIIEVCLMTRAIFNAAARNPSKTYFFSDFIIIGLRCPFI